MAGRAGMETSVTAYLFNGFAYQAPQKQKKQLQPASYTSHLAHGSTPGQ